MNENRLIQKKKHGVKSRDTRLGWMDGCCYGDAH